MVSSWGGGGVVTWSHPGGGGVVTWSHRGGGGGVVTWSHPGGGMVLSTPPPPKYYRMTDACKNITFARFATRAVKKEFHSN